MMEMETRMVLPVYDAVLLPDVDMRLSADAVSEEERSRIKIDGGKIAIVPLKAEKDPKERNALTGEDFYPLGVAAEVLEISNERFGVVMHVQTREKISISQVTANSGIVEAVCTPVDELMDVTEESEDKLLNSLKKQCTELAGNIRGGEYAIEYIKMIGSVNEFACAFLNFFDMSPEEKYQLLETDSFKERGELIHEALMRFKAGIDLQVTLANREDPENTAYKKHAISKQMKLLQKELDDLEGGSSEDEDSFRAKIERCHMPEEAEKEALRVLKRFEQEPENGAEYNSLYDYLDFLTSLPWQAEEQKDIDMKNARKILDRDHYGLKKVKERILEHLAVMQLNGKQNGSILLLVGAPGTGKTSMGRSVAEAMGRKYVRISLGGIRDEAEIRGHRRTYIGSMPGRIMEGIKRAGSMNPVVVLDEVDKIRSSFDGDPSSALLEALDPEQNSTFTDHYANVPYDLSHVFFICTANTWDTIPRPLLDRMEMIELPGYTPEEHFQIAKRHLVPQALADTGLKKTDIRFTDGALRKIISEYTFEAGVRGLKKQIQAVCRKAAVEIVEGKLEDKQKAAEGKEVPKRKTLVVAERNVEKYLGKKIINHEKVMKENPAGVVTGLAWTQAGGEILFIESVAMDGGGHIHLTGQIGDVMKESADTAVSLVKSTFMGSGYDFGGKDIHIHIPEGAVPKDGPSAGITMFTAIVSLVTGKPVSPYLAMTGEISLRGQVLPIGGLPEKLMAAERSGVKKVLIPKENVRDLEDVPAEIRGKLEIVPVTNVTEVIREALDMELPARSAQPFRRENGQEEDELRFN